MIRRSTCPLCGNAVSIDDDKCSKCGVSKFQLPSNCSPIEAARHLEFWSKYWATEEQRKSLVYLYKNYGICWCKDVRRFIAIKGVYSDYSLDAARQCAKGEILCSPDVPSDSFAISKVDLVFVGNMLALSKEFPIASDLANWLNSSSLYTLKAKCKELRAKSANSLPSVFDIVFGLVFILCTIMFGGPGNGNRDEAEKTLESLQRAIQLRFGEKSI